MAAYMKLQIKVDVRTATNVNFTTVSVTLTPESFFSSVRTELGRHLEYPPELLKFVIGERQLWKEDYDHTPLSECDVTEGTLICIMCEKGDIRLVKYDPKRVMFLMGFHKRVGSHSSHTLYLTQSSIYEPALLRCIFELAGPSVKYPRRCVVAVVYALKRKKITVFKPVCSKYGQISELKERLSTLCGVPSFHMVVADVYQNRIFRFLKDDHGISELRFDDKIVVFEVPNFEAGCVPVQVLHQKVEESQFEWEAKRLYPRVVGLPGVIAMPKNKTINAKQIRKLVSQCVEPFLKKGGVHGKSYKIITLDNSGRRCLICDFMDSCAGCELHKQAQLEVGLGRLSLAVQWKNPKHYDFAKASFKVRMQFVPLCFEY